MYDHLDRLDTQDHAQPDRRPLLNSTYPLFTVLLDDEAQIMTGLRQVIEEKLDLSKPHQTGA